MVKCICDKAPSFGLIDDKRPSCCYDCKTDNMVNIISKKCKCKKHIPIYGLIGDNKATCCYDCKTSDMIDIVHKRCMCDKIPVYGLISDKKATHCYECKTDNMITIFELNELFIEHIDNISQLMDYVKIYESLNKNAMKIQFYSQKIKPILENETENLDTVIYLLYDNK